MLIGSLYSVLWAHWLFTVVWERPKNRKWGTSLAVSCAVNSQQLCGILQKKHCTPVLHHLLRPPETLSSFVTIPFSPPANQTFLYPLSSHNPHPQKTAILLYYTCEAHIFSPLQLSSIAQLCHAGVRYHKIVVCIVKNLEIREEMGIHYFN